MLKLMLLNAVLVPGQTTIPVGTHTPALPRGARIISVRELPASEAKPTPAPANGQAASGCCDMQCFPCDSCGKKDCNVEWLRRWKCEDLKPKEPEDKCKKKKCCGGGLGGLLWCPKEEEESKECNGSGEEKKENGNGEKKENGNGEKKENGNGEKKENGNGCENGEKKEEEEETPTPLMQLLKCLSPVGDSCCDSGCKKEKKAKVYGWLQGGYTVNFDSPSDRLNYGVNYNNRSNDFTFNQAYLVFEKLVDLDKGKDEFQIGFRADFFAGHDAPYYENFLGIFPDFTGDRLEQPGLTDIGISIPQAYADLHLPVLTDRGVDLRLGRFYARVGYESEPAPQSQFYSHSYEFFYGTAFTHFGALAIVHVGDTLDVASGIVRGWDVAFSDTNSTCSYIGSATWNSCDTKGYFHVGWIFGPEQLQNNSNIRSLITAHYSRVFGDQDQWKFITGGNLGWEQNATLDVTSPVRSAEWYGLVNYLFYTVDPRLTLGLRGEWFRDDDGSRTIFTNSDNGGALWNRPGYAGNFYELTVGATWKPFQNLRVRPELRFDWFDGRAIDGSASLPFNDQRDKFQITSGFDVIYEF